MTQELIHKWPRIDPRDELKKGYKINKTRYSRIRWLIDRHSVTVTDWQAFGQSDWQIDRHSVNQIDRLTSIPAIRLTDWQTFGQSSEYIFVNSTLAIDQLTGIPAIRLTDWQTFGQSSWQIDRHSGNQIDKPPVNKTESVTTPCHHHWFPALPPRQQINI